MTSHGMPNASHTCATAPPSSRSPFRPTHPAAVLALSRSSGTGRPTALCRRRFGRGLRSRPAAAFEDGRALVGRISESICRVDQGHGQADTCARARAEHACIVLNHEIGDDDVADRAGSVTASTCHSGENDCAAAESIGQQCGRGLRSASAHPRAREHYRGRRSCRCRSPCAPAATLWESASAARRCAAPEGSRGSIPMVTSRAGGGRSWRRRNAIDPGRHRRRGKDSPAPTASALRRNFLWRCALQRRRPDRSAATGAARRPGGGDSSHRGPLRCK